jgi:NAD(P)-dependent dehydrogenase (short-subunit alcohol dehydrogenase family)
MKFKNKVVLITGGSRGIGKAIALTFAKEGANIIINYNTSDPNFVLNEINRERESKIIAIQADISKEKEVKNLISRGIKEFGKIDILINNAGIVFDENYKNKTVEH